MCAEIRARLARVCRRPFPAFVAAALLAAVAVVADPYPPYWSSGSGTSIHYTPVAWPAGGSATTNWTPYTRIGSDIADKRDTDGSNGGTSPQGYVNVSSGCTDVTEPSVYYAYDSASQVLFFRWRVQSPPHTFATGPNPGTYGSSSPWSSALWTVFMDTNGDGYRDFAVHLDGSSGSPSASVDRLVSIWSNTKSQSLDYVNDSSIKLLRHNPAAFVDGPSGTDRILNFHTSLSPDATWANGSSETVWDYGTTRASLLGTSCGEYFIDYQIPLAMLNASAVGGPTVTPNTPMSLFFATANSLQNPIQKDAVVAGDFIADPTKPVPGGDTITPAGGTIVQPIVNSLTASGCGSTSLTAYVFDTLNLDRTSTVSSVAFYYYADGNGNGAADDSSTWTLAANGSAAADPVGKWTGTWNSTSLVTGRYLLAVKATDASGNVTWSQYSSQTDVNTFTGGAAGNFPNATGAVTASMVNSCGAAGPSIAKTVSPSFVSATGTVTFTVSIANTLSSPITVSSIVDALPAGFTYASTTGGTIGAATTSPSAGASGNITWSFSPSASIPASSTRTLIFTATAGSTAGTFTNTVSASTSYGTLSSSGTEVGVGTPSLTIGKSASVTSANAGDAVAYTITYANDSAVSVTNAVITDTLPTGLDFVSATGGGTYSSGTRTVTWNIGSIASGSGAASVVVNTTITNPYPAAAAIPVINTASIASTETSASSASVPVYVNSARAQLSIQKEGSVSQVSAGSSVTYTLTYTNTGASVASGVAITDVIPAGWSFVSATGGGTNSSGTVTWNIGSLAAAASGSVQLVLQAGSPYTGANPSTNTATLSGTGLTSATDSFNVAVVQTGSVCTTYYFQTATTNVGTDGAQKTANTTAVTSSDTGGTATATSASSSSTVELVRFYLDPAVTSQVTMSGNLSSNIYIDRSNGSGVNVTGTVYDYNPADGTKTSLGAVTSSFNGSAKGLFSFTIPVSGSLLAGHRLLWIYTFASANSQSVQLYAEFGGRVTNPLSGGTTDALAQSSFCATAPANPTLDKQVDKLVAAPGDTLTYTIKFGNAGGTNMTSASVVDTLPNGVTFTSATLNGSAATAASVTGQQRSYNVNTSDTGTAGQLTAGQTGTLVIVGTVSSPFTGGSDTLTNSVSLSSNQTSTTSDSIGTVLQRPSVTIAKSADRTLLVPGDTVTYTLSVLNSGPGAASNVTVGDSLPATAYFTYVAGSAKLNGSTISPDPVSGNTLTKNIGSLAAGSAAAVTFQMIVASSGAPSGTTSIANTATVSDAGTSGTRSSNGSTLTISTNPNLTITKVSSPASGPVAPGSTIAYTVTVTNTGSGDAASVSVRDSIPSNTTYTAGSMKYAAVSQTDAGGDDNGTFDDAGNRVLFSIGALAAGASKAMTYDVTVNSPLSNGTTSISSTATVTASNASSRQATASITASAAPVLSLVKSAPSSVAFPLTTLASTASGATSITVASVSALGVGDVISVGGTDATVTAISGTTVTLGTAVSGANGTQVLPTWEYRLAYANTGTAAATSVVISDVLPAGLTFVSADSGGSNSSGTVTWNLGTVASGTSGTVRVRVRPGSATSYSNTATLASSELSTVTSNSTATATGSLTVAKTTSTPSGSTSGNATSVTYVITLQNQSPTTAASNVAVQDDLAAGFTYTGTTSISGATASSSPTVGDTSPTWSGMTVAAGSTATITFTAKVSNVAPGTYQNYVTVTSSNANVLGFDALSTTAEDVSIAASLGTTGVVAITATTAPGGTETITVTDADLNADPAAAETVQVTVVNTRTNESETVTLTETGANTGVFAGTLATNNSSSAGANNSAPINAASGDTLRASYTDALTSTGGAATVTADGSVVAANQAPVAAMTAAALSYTENAGAVPIDTGLTVTDADSANLASATVTISANYVNGEDVLAFTNQNGISGNWNATTGVLTLTGSATVANYQTALRSVTYANSSENPSTATRTVSVVANDGAASSNTATRNITVAATDDAPVVTMTAAALAFTESGSAASIDTGLTVTDADSANLASATVTISANYVTGEDVLAFTNQNGISGSWNATTGVLTLTGSATVANYQTALRSVTYVNTSENPSTSTRTLSVVANDGSNNSNTATRSVTVTATDDAPVVTMTAAALAFTENGPAASIDTGLTVTDADSANLASATVTISANYVNGEDVLAFTNQNGISGSWNATTGVLTLTGSATVANYQTALRSVTYANSSENPSTSTRTVSVVANDGAASSNTATRNITVAATDDAPVVTMTAAALAFTENGSATSIDTGLTVTDADSANLASATVTISANYVNAEDVLAFTNQNGIIGSWNAATGVLTLTGSATVANYQTALRSVTYVNTSENPSTSTRTLSAVANDGSNNSNIATRIVTVTATDDAPVVTMTAAALAFTENGPAASIDTGLTVTDADSANLASATVTISANYVNGEDMLAFTNQNGISGNWNATTGVLTLTGSATVANYQAALWSVTYVNTNTNPSTATRTFSVVVNDGTANSNTATRNVTVAATDDAPVVMMTAAALAFTENGSAASIDTGLTVTDADSANLASATVTISANYVTGEDVLAFTNQNGISGSWNATTGVLTLTGSATVANYQTALRSVTYANGSENPSTSTRTVSVVANDGAASSNTATRNITVAATDDAPVVTMTAAALAFTENGSAASIDTGLTVTDADSANLASATVRISVNYLSGEDVLAFTNQNGITGSWNATTGVLTLTGSATMANYRAALRSITYVNTSEKPSMAARTIAVAVNDGSADSNTASRAITVSAVNDPPVVTMDATAMAYGTNTGAVAVDTALTVADPDSTTLTGATMTISAGFAAGEDVLAFAAQNGITGSYDAAIGVMTLTGSAAVADYQAALRSITFTHGTTPRSAQTRTVSVTVTDGALTSNAATRGITIDQRAADPAATPSLDQPSAVTVDEDSPSRTVTLTGIAAASSGTLSVAAQPGDASLFSAFAVTYTAGSTTASLAFSPAADAFGATDVAVTVSETKNGATLTSTRTFRITINPVNDRPAMDAPADVAGKVGVAHNVTLSGIGAGAGNETQPLTVTATSSDPAIVPDPVVNYASPGATGTLTLTPAKTGRAVITVTVEDGQDANRSFSRTFTVTSETSVNTPPTITPIADISVIEGNPLPAVAFTVGDSETPVSALTVNVRTDNGTLIPAVGLALTGGGASRGLTLTNAAYKIGTGRIVVTVSDGELSASASFNAIVRPQWDYYLSEGSAQAAFATSIRATNPHGGNAPVRLMFLKPEGAPQVQLFDIPAMTRWSAQLSDVAAAGQGDVSTFIRSVDNLPLLVERSMTWDGDARAGSAESALESTNLQWYFAEGSRGALRTQLVLANPHDEDVSVTVTFLLEGGAPVARTYTVGPLLRRTITFADVTELAARNFGMIVDATLPIAAERTAYIDAPRERQTGATATGVAYPSRTWYFAEGSNWKIFQSFMLLLNPGLTAANVTIDYHTMGGTHFTTTHVVNPRSRLTVDTLKAEPRLDGQHFWMAVTSDQPIAAERAMYWDRGMGAFSESHSSHGVIEPSRRWSTGDARVGGPQQYSTFVLIGNPSSQTATLKVTIRRDSGEEIVSSRRLAPNGRDTINVNTAVPALSNESFWLQIDSDVPILAERSQYWNPEGSRGSWSGGTNVFALPVVAPDYNGCSYNVGPAQVTAAAQGVRFTVHVGATSRCTFTAEPQVSWIHVISGGSGSGASSVELRVDPNSVRSPRTGTVTIAGRPVVVAQDAAPAAGVGDPQMALTSPANGARVGSTFRVTGWAVDLMAVDNTSGVGTIHVWAYPNPGSNAAPIFLGEADYGGEWAALETQFGERTRKAGFSLMVRGLPAGVYQIAVFAYSTVTGSFNQVRTAIVNVVPEPYVIIDTPGAGKVTQPAMIAGWALDASADGSTGIDAVHVWAYPSTGAAPIFVGAATYGHHRPDVAAAFGKPEFANSGYGVTLTGLAPGRYNVTVFARRTGATAFDAVKVVPIEIGGVPGATAEEIDLLHVWAYPSDGKSPVFVGASTDRAFAGNLGELADGTYQVVTFGRRASTGAFEALTTRVVTISGKRPE